MALIATGVLIDTTAQYSCSFKTFIQFHLQAYKNGSYHAYIDKNRPLQDLEVVFETHPVRIHI